MTHLEQLALHVPNLLSRKMVDVGAGRGKFLFAAMAKGANVVGVEPSSDYVRMIIAEAKERGVSVKIVEGVGEHTEFSDAEFDFANVSEVFEHVDSPDLLLLELHRILSGEGMAYLSIPNRYGFRDPHFLLYAVNWIPRVYADAFIGLFGRHKNYANDGAGRQRLSEMHYKTYAEAMRIFQKHGFVATDVREKKLRKIFENPLAFVVAFLFYVPFRQLYFDTHHFVLTKIDETA